jgi:hypothetical protein
MKLSVEAKVAAAVAAGFVALTLGAIAQGNGASQIAGADVYGPTSNPTVNVQRYNNSPAGRMNAQENRQKFSSEDDMAAAKKSGKKTNSIKTRKHHTQGGRQIERI